MVAPNPPLTPFAMKTIDLKEKYALINAQWTLHVVAELNGQQVKLQTGREFVWYAHDEEDEMFYVVKGAEMRFRDSVQHVGTGQMIVVPAGVEHCPVAAAETWIMLVEPALRPYRWSGNPVTRGTLRAHLMP